MKRNIVVAQQKFMNQIQDFASFKLLLDTLPDTAFFIKDRKGRVMLFNRRACEIYNIDHESDVFGKTDDELHPKALAEKYRRDDQRVMRSRKPILNAMELGPSKPERIVVYSKVPLFDHARKVIGIAGLYRFVDVVRDAPDWYGRLSHMMEHIHAHYAEQLRMEELSTLARISERQLERRFLAIFGMTITEYILRTRISVAIDLLETTDRTLSDIGQAVGFYDHSHFIRIFKRERGCSPRQYRLRHQNAF